jgi:hypothetical protein
MKLIKSITVFTGNDTFTLDLSNYDEIRDETLEFPDHSEFVITFYKSNNMVRRILNPSCDIVYQDIIN